MGSGKARYVLGERLAEFLHTKTCILKYVFLRMYLLALKPHVFGCCPRGWGRRYAAPHTKEFLVRQYRG